MREILLDDRVCDISAKFTEAHGVIKLIARLIETDDSPNSRQFRTYFLWTAELAQKLRPVFDDMAIKENQNVSFAPTFLANKELHALTIECCEASQRMDDLKAIDSQIQLDCLEAVYAVSSTLNEVCSLFDSFIVEPPAIAA